MTDIALCVTHGSSSRWTTLIRSAVPFPVATPAVLRARDTERLLLLHRRLPGDRMARCVAVTDAAAGDQGQSKTSYGVVVGGADAGLDKRLSDELDTFNAAATAGTAPARELTVQVVDESGELAAGMSGWTWGVAAGIGMTWVREASRGDGLGARLLAEFEAEARVRGSEHVFVTSFTFQAPGFYERHGYREIFRWEGVPTPDAADVHLRKDL